MTLEQQVKSFYSDIKFPGYYTMDNISFYKNYHKNVFIEPYRDAAKASKNILDIGCGTGFITNLLALENVELHIDAIDFSDSIDFAKQFSLSNSLYNVNYYQSCLFDFDIHNYDLIISNGVLHHIPNYKLAFHKLNSSNAKTIVLGLYNKYGKINNKQIKFRSELLYLDQIKVPFEVSFSHNQVCKFLSNYKLANVYPSFKNKLVDLYNIFNRDNGGLTIYTFVKT